MLRAKPASNLNIEEAMEILYVWKSIKCLKGVDVHLRYTIDDKESEGDQDVSMHASQLLKLREV